MSKHTLYKIGYYLSRASVIPVIISIILVVAIDNLRDAIVPFMLCCQLSFFMLAICVGIAIKLKEPD